MLKIPDSMLYDQHETGSTDSELTSIENQEPSETKQEGTTSLPTSGPLLCISGVLIIFLVVTLMKEFLPTPHNVDGAASSTSAEYLRGSVDAGTGGGL